MDIADLSPIQILVKDAKDNDFQVVVWSGRTIISRSHKIGLEIGQDGSICKKVDGEGLTLGQAREYLGLDRDMAEA
ncbi:hypothetical protein [Hydrogenophaga sp. NFH-34]|uniref:hypothetical protein n=1 Tax=Hydrogenophaga sp. NFH-34 TaxID=2744446 RepID=UPI001F21208D|nr:hypothetical protein [Hydrogenophaga sp. NFH-34]